MVPDIDGPRHAYLPAIPGCWELFGRVQAEELQNYAYPPSHRLVVDTYCAQHPGPGTDRRDRQSVAFHLASLFVVLELGLDAQSVDLALQPADQDVCGLPGAESSEPTGNAHGRVHAEQQESRRLHRAGARLGGERLGQLAARTPADSRSDRRESLAPTGRRQCGGRSTRPDVRSATAPPGPAPGIRHRARPRQVRQRSTSDRPERLLVR